MGRGGRGAARPQEGFVWPCCWGSDGSSRRLWEAHWPVVSAPVSMGMLVGGVRRKGKLERVRGSHTSAADLAGVSRGMRAVSQYSTHGHRRAIVGACPQTQSKTCPWIHYIGNSR